MNATNLLVTGGAGFLGSNFVSRSLATRPNLKITVLDKLTYAGKRDNLPSESEQFRFVLGDILDQEVVNEETARADIVIHFAAETHNDNSLTAPRVFFETNVMGTEAVARAASLQRKRFHHISTDEVFGDLPLETDETFSEDSQYKPSSPYSASKAASDHLVRSFVRSFGLRATITNCSNNFGLNQNWEKFIPHSIQDAVNGRPIRIYGTGRNVRDWIHVDDHTDGVWSVLDRGTLGETYLLGGNNQIDNLSLARMILDALGLPSDYIEFVDDRPGHDLRYAMNYSKASNMLGWNPKKTSNFKHELELVVLNYKNKILNGDSVV